MRVEERPLVRWVPVVGREGRRHLEMRWHVPAAAGARQLPGPA
ncbi:hypothetical protein [Geodermatophilus sp. URMC 62]